MDTDRSTFTSSDSKKEEAIELTATIACSVSARCAGDQAMSIEKHLSTISKSLYVIAEIELAKSQHWASKTLCTIEDMLDEIRKELDGPTAYDMNNKKGEE